jgi:MHS family shikimate/dehydroshikimate transporter-like MFS transporter
MSGVSSVYQIGAVLSHTPLVATALLQANNNEPWLIAAYVSAAGVISAICAAAMNRVP